MNKVLLIIKREFVSRVKKKSFLIATILTPLIFPAILGGMWYFAMQEKNNAEKQTVQVLDESGHFSFEDSTKYNYVYLSGNLEAAKTAFNETEDFALVYIPKFNLEKPEGIVFYSKTNPSLSVIGDFEKHFENKIRDLKLEKYDIDKETLQSLKSDVEIRSINLSDLGNEKESSAGVAFGIGYGSCFLIYMFIFIYGAQIMQGVIEEKSSKIVEVLVSTVRPFQLMIGKIIGIASVGLTQFLIWIIIMGSIYTIAISQMDIDLAQHTMAGQMIQNMPNSEEAQTIMASSPKVQKVFRIINDIPFTQIILTFIFYFIGGYLMYGALFAAVGSAVDSPGEAQQFMLPITIPLIASMVATFIFILQDPESKISFWLSIIPFTSPIAMMGRIGFGVPAWEIALSMMLLVGGFILTTWVAARIYRVGILMHGTKVNYKVLAKWFMLKG